jgi:hypothetical protein
MNAFGSCGGGCESAGLRRYAWDKSLTAGRESVEWARK